MHAIQRQHGASLEACESKDLGIRHPAAQQAAERDHVVTMNSQRLDHRERHILVGEQPRHNSGRLVLDDLALDLFAVAADVGPGICQILGA